MKAFAKKIENILKKQEMDTEKWYVFKYCSHIPDSTLFYTTFSTSKESPLDKVTYLKNFLDPLFRTFQNYQPTVTYLENFLDPLFGQFQNYQFTVTIFIKKMPIFHSLLSYSSVRINIPSKNRKKDIRKVDVTFINKKILRYNITFKEGLCRKSKLRKLPALLKNVTFFEVGYKKGLIEIKTDGGFSTSLGKNIKNTCEILKNADKIVSYFSSVMT